MSRSNSSYSSPTSSSSRSSTVTMPSVPPYSLMTMASGWRSRCMRRRAGSTPIDSGRAMAGRQWSATRPVASTRSTRLATPATSSRSPPYTGARTWAAAAIRRTASAAGRSPGRASTSRRRTTTARRRRSVSSRAPTRMVRCSVGKLGWLAIMSGTSASVAGSRWAAGSTPARRTRTSEDTDSSHTSGRVAVEMAARGRAATLAQPSERCRAIRLGASSPTTSDAKLSTMVTTTMAAGSAQVPRNESGWTRGRDTAATAEARNPARVMPICTVDRNWLGSRASSATSRPRPPSASRRRSCPSRSEISATSLPAKAALTTISTSTRPISNPMPLILSLPVRRALGRRLPGVAVPGGDGVEAGLDRQGEGEDRAVAQAAGHPDAAAHGLDQALGQVQAEPGPARLPGQVVADAVEALEDPALLVDGDARAPVADLEHDLAALGDEADLDRLVGRGVAQGVGEQVAQHLVDPHPVAAAVGGVVGGDHVHRAVRVLAGEAVHDLADQVDGVDGGGVDQPGPGLQPGHLQQVLDQPLQTLGLHQHQLVVLAPPVLGEVAVRAQQRHQEALDGGERGPQLVGDAGHEVGLELVGLAFAGDVAHHHHVGVHLAGAPDDGGVGIADPAGQALLVEHRGVADLLVTGGGRGHDRAVGGAHVDAVAVAGPEQVEALLPHRLVLLVPGEGDHGRVPGADGAVRPDGVDAVGGVADDVAQGGPLVLGGPVQLLVDQGRRPLVG